VNLRSLRKRPACVFLRIGSRSRFANAIAFTGFFRARSARSLAPPCSELVAATRALEETLMKLNALLQAIGASERLLESPGTSLWNAGAVSVVPAPTGSCHRDAQTVTLRIFSPADEATPPTEVFFAQFRAQETLAEPPAPMNSDRFLSDAEQSARRPSTLYAQVIARASIPVDSQARLAVEPEKIWRLSQARIRSLPTPLSESQAVELFRSVCAASTPQLILEGARANGAQPLQSAKKTPSKAALATPSAAPLGEACENEHFLIRAPRSEPSTAALA